jgi:hypothetical protein
MADAKRPVDVRSPVKIHEGGEGFTSLAACSGPYNALQPWPRRKAKRYLRRVAIYDGIKRGSIAAYRRLRSSGLRNSLEPSPGGLEDRSCTDSISQMDRSSFERDSPTASMSQTQSIRRAASAIRDLMRRAGSNDRSNKIRPSRKSNTGRQLFCPYTFRSDAIASSGCRLASKPRKICGVAVSSVTMAGRDRSFGAKPDKNLVDH